MFLPVLSFNKHPFTRERNFFLKCHFNIRILIDGDENKTPLKLQTLFLWKIGRNNRTRKQTKFSVVTAQKSYSLISSFDTVLIYSFLNKSIYFYKLYSKLGSDLFSALLQVTTLGHFWNSISSSAEEWFSDCETRLNTLVTSYQLKGVFKLEECSLVESRLVFTCW